MQGLDVWTLACFSVRERLVWNRSDADQWASVWLYARDEDRNRQRSLLLTASAIPSSKQGWRWEVREERSGWRDQDMRKGAPHPPLTQIRLALLPRELQASHGIFNTKSFVAILDAPQINHSHRHLAQDIHFFALSQQWHQLQQQYVEREPLCCLVNLNVLPGIWSADNWHS